MACFFLVETAGSTPNHKCVSLISNAKPYKGGSVKRIEKRVGSRPSLLARGNFCLYQTITDFIFFITYYFCNHRSLFIPELIGSK